MVDTSPVTKYPQTSEDVAGFYAWTNRDDMRLDDGACARAQTTANRIYKALVKDWGFNIPTNATITKIELGIKGHYGGTSINHPTLEFRIGMFSYYLSADTPGTACGDCAWWWYDVTAWGYSGWTPADFNNPNFTTNVISQNIFPYSILHDVDAVAIRVTFTLPSPVKCMGDGLTWIVAYCKNKLTVKKVIGGDKIGQI